MAGARLDGLKLWPYEEARRLLTRGAGNAGEFVFEAGFGPSGLPHLGTMAEILRPSFVRHALRLLAPERPSRLTVFIDDMDGLRKVPENVPDRERVEQFLGRPVSDIPDPFGCCESFAGHMVDLLRKFLEPLALEYELMRASRTYASGRFDPVLRLILHKHREIIGIMTPTLRDENRAGWSPFLPICPRCGQVNSTRVTAYHPERGTVEFSCDRTFGNARPCGLSAEQSVLGGRAKVQWKIDWALRWRVLGVDYELYGKDLIDSARLSGQIVRLLCGEPPLGFPFEMFLDEQGHKVSKSVGRGVTVEQWQRYAPIEALKYFLFVNPRRARKLFLGAIPQYVDDYLDELRAYAAADVDEKRLDSPLEFVLSGTSPRRFNSDLSFSLIMNLASALGVSDRELMWNYLTRYDPGIVADEDTRKMAEALLDCALNFRRDYLEPALLPYEPQAEDHAIAEKLIAFLTNAPDAGARDIETAIYDIGRELFPEKPGKVFQPLYRMIMQQDRGPRLGAFIRLATPQRVIAILEQRLGR
jgi:lysyl-tRNA synthetase class 1